MVWASVADAFTLRIRGVCCAGWDSRSCLSPVYHPAMSPVRKAADDSASCRDAIKQSASTWREVATLTGLSHEWARQLVMRMDVRPVKPRRRSKRAPRPPWNSPHIVKRFWEQVEVNGPPAFGFAEPTRCWMWRGKTNAEGYGVNRAELHVLRHCANSG